MKTLSKPRVLHLALVTLALLASAGCNRELTADTAKEVIAKHGRYPQAISDAVLQTGQRWGCSANDDSVADQRLVKAGVLTVVATGQPERSVLSQCSDGMTREFQVTLTPAAEKLQMDTSSVGPMLRECELDFGEVTGIEKHDRDAIVAYTGRFVRPTAFAPFGGHRDQCLAGTVMTYSATLSRTDDGWTVEQTP